MLPVPRGPAGNHPSSHPERDFSPNRGPYALRVSVRFVILCLGRTGSSHLQSLLDSHPSIRCFGELFSDKAPARSPAFVNSPYEDEAVYLEHIVRESESPVVGFKLPMNSIKARPESARLVAGDHAMRVIRLSRGNRLAQLISQRLQHATRVSHSLQGGYASATVHIDVDWAVRALERAEEHELELDRLADEHPCHRILYEELGGREPLEEVQRFLGVEPAALRSWFEKLRRQPLSETVENWDELVAGLRETRFGHFAVEAL